MGRRVAILGDIHVHVDSQPTPALKTMIARVAELQPDLVVLAGDLTSGNAGDGHDADVVASWWRGLAGAIAPLRAAGIPVLPIAGNHDYYTPAHQAGYQAAWADLASSVGSLTLRGEPPLYYSVELDGLHLALVHAVDQKLEPAVAAWLRDDLAGASASDLRLAIGHVPMVSAIGRSSERFQRALSELLASGGVTAYFCGHEHVAWDQVVDAGGGRTVRQVTVGTAGASYTFPLRRDLFDAYCADGVGKMPGSGCAFAIDPATRKQHDKIAMVLVVVDGVDYDVQFYALGPDGQLAPFAAASPASTSSASSAGAGAPPEPEPESDGDVRWLQQALNRVLGTHLEIDGEAGPATREAVERFQARAGLTVDGIAGPLTRRALTKAMATDGRK
jgi:3',5'-cyclic AMP phosphodiesterase CpdA